MDEIIDILEGLQRNHRLDCRRRTRRIGMLQSIWRDWVEEFKVQFGFYQNRYRKSKIVRLQRFHRLSIITA